jgi:hypothetical protein
MGSWCISVFNKLCSGKHAPDILPRLKPVGFCLSSLCFLMCRHRRAFRRAILSSFGVPIIHRVAPLGVSVLPSNASLSALDRDTLQSHSNLDEEWKCSQPDAEVLSEQSSIQDLRARLSTRGVSCLQCFWGGFLDNVCVERIHPTTKVMGFLRHVS